MRNHAHAKLPAVLIAALITWPQFAMAEREPRALEAQQQAVELGGRTMGTTYRLKYWGDGAATPVRVHENVEALLARFDEQMSTYREDSELARFNAAGAGEWIPVSCETAHVIAKAIEFHKLTNGALDITVAPLSQLWRFGPHDPKQRQAMAPPTTDDIERALQSVGVEHLKLRHDRPALWKDRRDVEIDLSAIAPGYAVDLIIERLQSLGFANAMVEIGGEVRGVGVRPDGKPWLVGVERAGRPTADFIKVVPLKNLALTTAGDYRNLRTLGEKRYTHIIDPRTGEALPRRGLAVTVLAETAIEADALDTALLVMDADEAYTWCVKHGVAALFQQGDNGSETRTTPRFDELLNGSDDAHSKE